MAVASPPKRTTFEDTNDYLVILASWIHEVCHELGEDNDRQIAKLQRVIDDLLYLSKNYKISKNS